VKTTTPLAAAALAALAFPGIASAAGPWTTTNPGGVTWTAPNDCTLQLDLTTWDGYPARVDMTQAYELVVAYRNGVEIGRTIDLKDKQVTWTESKRITAPVAAGDVVTVRHSSLAGLNDGTPNSVNVSASFTCPPPASTTTSSTTTTTSTTIAPTTTVAETVPPTSVATGVPPTLPSTTVPVPSSVASATTVLVSPPRTPSVSVPPNPTTFVVLPETGQDMTIPALVAGICVAAGAAFVGLTRRRA
jgi:LPXTG-motif cell wall-anchored protein